MWGGSRTGKSRVDLRPALASLACFFLISFASEKLILPSLLFFKRAFPETWNWWYQLVICRDFNEIYITSIFIWIIKWIIQVVVPFASILSDAEECVPNGEQKGSNQEGNTNICID